jgi:transcriptional regulator with XRE-family HTH domain
MAMAKYGNSKNHNIFRTRLRAWREKAGLSLSAAAAELGFSRATLGPVELGRLDPTPFIAARLEQRFGEPVAALLKPVTERALPRLLDADLVERNAAAR